MSTFTVFPAVDLRGGHVVRLQEGDPDRQTNYSSEPAHIAQRWLEAGAQWLHVVNLEGALDETDGANQAALQSILETAKAYEAQVQFGGGIRSLRAVERFLKLGVSRVVLGTVAIEQPQTVHQALKEFGENRIAVGIDARDGFVRVHGWQANSGVRATDLALQVKTLGVRTLIFTDISRDGVGSGLNLPATRALAATTGLEVIASGGVKGMEDVLAARRARLAGVIIGRALYDGLLDLKVALQSASPTSATNG